MPKAAPGIAAPDGCSCSCTDPAPARILLHPQPWEQGLSFLRPGFAEQALPSAPEGNPNPQTLGMGIHIPSQRVFPSSR